MLPQVINRPPIIVLIFIGSLNIIKDRQIVIGTLNLSIGATRETLPI